MSAWLVGAVVLCAGNLGLALWYVYRMSAVVDRLTIERDALAAAVASRDAMLTEMRRQLTEEIKLVAERIVKVE